jgi:hypothetical protein
MLFREERAGNVGFVFCTNILLLAPFHFDFLRVPFLQFLGNALS